MSELLRYTMFQDVLFPEVSSQIEAGTSAGIENLTLNRLIRFSPDGHHVWQDGRYVVFDFETTGLDSSEDYIIEIGAQKFENGRLLGEFSTLVRPPIAIGDHITKITGISQDMLADQPTIDMVLDEFLEFMRGGILIAHNADFDIAFLTAACARQGIILQWPCFCSLKLARHFLPQLESKSLDALASHYQLQFEARHRSIGDVKVLVSVLEKLFENEARELKTWDKVAEIAAVRVEAQ